MAKLSLRITSLFNRRQLLGLGLAGGIGWLAEIFGDARRRYPGIPLPLPGALPSKDFYAACTRCFRCANACPNDCIKFHDLSAGLNKAFTPYIKARERGCILCGECSKACPTGALQTYEVSRDGWKSHINMGIARVNKEMCYSFNGRTCGACYQACPLAGEAMKIGVFETPHVKPEICVGCGLCEQACLHLPQAIRVLPLKIHS